MTLHPASQAIQPGSPFCIRFGITSRLLLIAAVMVLPRLRAANEPPDDSKRLAQIVTNLPELPLPDEWYEVDANKKLPARWKEIARLQVKNGLKKSVPEATADLSQRFSNQGKCFKHSVFFNQPNSGAITIVNPRTNEFGTVRWKSVENARDGKKGLPAEDLLTLQRVLP